MQSIPPDSKDLVEYPLVLGLLKYGTLQRRGDGIFYAPQPASKPLLRVHEGRLAIPLETGWVEYLPPGEQASARMPRQVTPDDFALVGQSHNYRLPIMGHSWLNIYIPQVMNQELHHSKKDPSAFKGSMLDMADTVMMPSGMTIAGEITHSRNLISALSCGYVIPTTRQCALNLAMNAFLQSLAQGTPGLRKRYQSLPVWGSNCSRSGSECLEEVGYSSSRMFHAGMLLSPWQFGEALQRLPCEEEPMLRVSRLDGSVHVALHRTQTHDGHGILVLKDHGFGNHGYAQVNKRQKIKTTTRLLLHRYGDAMRECWFDGSHGKDFAYRPDAALDAPLLVERYPSPEKIPFQLRLGEESIYDSAWIQNAESRNR